MNKSHSINSTVQAFIAYRYILFLLLVLLGWAMSFPDTLLRMVALWKSSTTYNHCFAVLPICFYLVWVNRHEFLRFTPGVNLLWVPPLAASMLLWILAKLSEVDAVEYIATIAILITALGLFLGRKVSKVLWFPLLFMFFLVPVGDEIVPLLQVITAKAAVWLLGLTNIPVFFEGLFITIPAGKFVVAEACSGIRFLISSIFLGFLCANLFFRSYLKRILFISFSLFLPVAANILRVFGIILIGHYSDMRYAAGADHLIYGWFFFLFIIIIMVLVGRFFSEEVSVSTESVALKNTDDGWRQWPSSQSTVPLFAILLLCFFSMQHYVSRDFPVPGPLLATDISVSHRSLTKPPYRFIEKDIDVQARRVFALPDRDRTFYLVAEAFTGVDEKSELISWNNRLFDPDIWSIRDRQHHTLTFNDERIHIEILDLVSNASEPRSVAYWYRIPGYSGYQPLQIKMLQTANILRGKGRYGVMLQLTFDSYATGVDQNQMLADWLDQNYQHIHPLFLF